MSLYCEFGKPHRRLVSSYDELIQLINIYNGVANCYSTVYMFEELDESDNWRKKPNYDTAVIDRIFLDFDGENAFENMKEVHQKLLVHNIKHHVNFSGNGYHIFVYAEKERKIKYKKLALARYAISLTNDQDMQVVGDIARLVRIPNTLHINARRYCINITHEDIVKGEEHIREKAKKPHPNLRIMGENLVNLKEFDYPEEDFETFDSGLTEGMDLPAEIPGCVEHAMKSFNPRYYQRFLYFTYMRDLDFSMKSALEMVEKKWSVKKMRHCLKAERQPHSIWRNGVHFPDCDFIKSIGLCRRCSVKE